MTDRQKADKQKIVDLILGNIQCQKDCEECDHDDMLSCEEYQMRSLAEMLVKKGLTFGKDTNVPCKELGFETDTTVGRKRLLKCEICRKETDSLTLGVFNYDGSDSDQSVFVDLVDADEDGDDVAIMETSCNWTGYGMSEEEMMEDIRCPYCGQFPFKHREVQVYDVVRIVCFREDKKNESSGTY